MPRRASTRKQLTATCEFCGQMSFGFAAADCGCVLSQLFLEGKKPAYPGRGKPRASKSRGCIVKRATFS